LYYQVKNFEKASNTISEIKELGLVQNVEKQFQGMMKFDLHFLKFQIIESLFSIIFALEEKDDWNLWFNLSFPKGESQRSFSVYSRIAGLNKIYIMENYLKKPLEIDEITVPLWKHVFYYGTNLDQQNVDIEQNLANMCRILTRIAIKFSDRTDYNSYKHSLRCYPAGHRISFSPNGKSNRFHLASAENTAVFLEKIDKNNDIVVNIKYKAFSVEEDYRDIYLCIKLISNILHSRKAFIHNNQIEDVHFFSEKDNLIQTKSNLISHSIGITSLNQLHGIGRSLLSEQRYSEAISYFKKALRLDYKHLDSLYYLGVCYYYAGNLDEAIHFWNKVLNYQSKKYRKPVLLYLSKVHLDQKLFKKAMKKIKRLLKVFSKEKDDYLCSAYYLKVRIHFIEYTDQEEKGKEGDITSLRKAKSALLKAGEINYWEPYLWFNVGLALARRNLIDDSIGIFEIMLRHFPDKTEVFINLGYAYLTKGQLEKASSMILRAVELEPNIAKTWNTLLVLKLNKLELHNCSFVYEKAIENANSAIDVLDANINYGTILHRRNEYNKAVKYFSKAYDIDGDHVLAKTHFLECLYKL